jgi:MarR family transcriptional regulator for hemolysin
MPADLPMMSELPLWLQLNKVSKKYMDALSARLSHLGIRRHYFLLVAIGEGKGNLTQQQLADLLEVDKVAMVGILDALTKHGFVRRTPSRTDRRKHLIVLTPKAEKALPEIRRAIRNLNQRALSGLPGPLSSHFSTALLDIKAELEKVIRDQEAAGTAPAKSRRTAAKRK